MSWQLGLVNFISLRHNPFDSADDEEFENSPKGPSNPSLDLQNVKKNVVNTVPTSGEINSTRYTFLLRPKEFSSSRV